MLTSIKQPITIDKYRIAYEDNSALRGFNICIFLLFSNLIGGLTNYTTIIIGGVSK